MNNLLADPLALIFIIIPVGASCACLLASGLFNVGYLCVRVAKDFAAWLTETRPRTEPAVKERPRPYLVVAE